MSILKKNRRNSRYRYTRKTNTAPTRRRSSGVGHYSIFKKIFIAFFIFLILYFAVSKIKASLSSSDIMIINAIEVSATQNIKEAEIKTLLPFKEGDSLAAVDLNKAQKEIAKIKPELKSISIDKSWRKISIKIKERNPEAFIKKGNSLMAIDSDGVIFPLRGSMNDMKVPTIFCDNEEGQQEVLKFIISAKAINKAFFEDISTIKLNDFQNFTFITKENADIFWGDANYSDLRNKIAMFEKILVLAKSQNKKIEYIKASLYDDWGRMPVKFK